MKGNPSSQPPRPVVILGASYAAGLGIESLAGVPVLNAGVAGQQSVEMLDRFDSDVVAARPRAVIIWGFINDIFRASDAQQAASRIRGSYIEMVSRAKKHGIEPILATEVTIRPPDTWMETIMAAVGGLLGKKSYQDRINAQVMESNAWLTEFAGREGILVLDLQGAVADESGRRRREFIDADGSHITAEGYQALRQYAVPILERHLSAPARSR